MPKFDSSDKIFKSRIPEAGVQTPDDFITRINETAKNFKDLLQLANQMRSGPTSQKPAGTNMSVMENTDKSVAPAQTQQTQGSEIGQILQIAVAYGFGDEPIGKILTRIAPFTINQIIGVMQKAGQFNANRPQQ